MVTEEDNIERVCTIKYIWYPGFGRPTSYADCGKLHSHFISLRHLKGRHVKV